MLYASQAFLFMDKISKPLAILNFGNYKDNGVKKSVHPELYRLRS